MYSLLHLLAAVGVLRLLASLATASHLTTTPCSQSPTNFRLYANTTDNYAALGGPCGKKSSCGLFFTVPLEQATTYFTITPDGTLTIAAATSGPAKNPNLPAGFIATIDPSFALVFDFPTKKVAPRLQCGIQESAAGDGTCELFCGKAQKSGPPSKPPGFSLWTENAQELILGRFNDYVAVSVKVMF